MKNSQFVILATIWKPNHFLLLICELRKLPFTDSLTFAVILIWNKLRLCVYQTSKLFRISFSSTLYIYILVCCFLSLNILTLQGSSDTATVHVCNWSTRTGSGCAYPESYCQKDTVWTIRGKEDNPWIQWWLLVPFEGRLKFWKKHPKVAELGFSGFFRIKMIDSIFRISIMFESFWKRNCDVMQK